MSSFSDETELHNILVFNGLVKTTGKTNARRSSNADGCNKIGKSFYLQISRLGQCVDGTTIRLEISKDDGDHSTANYFHDFKLDTALTADLELAQDVFDKLDEEWNDIRSYNTPIVPKTPTSGEEKARRDANEDAAKIRQRQTDEEERKRMEERLQKEFPTLSGVRA